MCPRYAFEMSGSRERAGGRKWSLHDPAAMRKIAAPVTSFRFSPMSIPHIEPAPDTMPGKPLVVPPALPAIHASSKRKMVPGHMCTGPVAVNGAKPGQVLQVDI